MNDDCTCDPEPGGLACPVCIRIGERNDLYDVGCTWAEVDAIMEKRDAERAAARKEAR